MYLILHGSRTMNIFLVRSLPDEVLRVGSGAYIGHVVTPGPSLDCNSGFAQPPAMVWPPL
jgi:hypothetical protein